MAEDFHEYGLKGYIIAKTQDGKFEGGAYVRLTDNRHLGKLLYEDMRKSTYPSVKKAREKRAKQKLADQVKGKKMLDGATLSIRGPSAGKPSNAEDYEQCEREWELIQRQQKQFRDGQADDTRPDVPEDMTDTEKMATDRTASKRGDLSRELDEFGEYEDADKFVERAIELAKDSNVTPNEGTAPTGIGSPSKVSRRALPAFFPF